MIISVIKPGLLGTMQDTGRYGYGSLGINSGGAMDRFAAQVANMLTGNAVQEAVMEIHFPGPQLLFEQNALVSITGGDFTATLNDEVLPMWQPLLIRKNTILHFPKWQWGARCYIAVHGGFCVDKWLGSYSTNIKAVAGGHKGRRFEKGDEFAAKETALYFAGWLKANKDVRRLAWRADIRDTYRHPNEIFVIEGQEFTDLTSAAARHLLESNFNIHTFSDRMGYRLKGPALEMQSNKDMVSSAVTFGTIQLPPAADPIILMADHQTTGGYPRIAHVISAHLPKLAQLRPGDGIQFKLVTLHTAEQMFIQQQMELKFLELACHEQLNNLACKQ